MLYSGYFHAVLLQRGATVHRGHEVTVRRDNGLLRQVYPLKLYAMIGRSGMKGQRHLLSGMQSHTCDGKLLLYSLLK